MRISNTSRHDRSLFENGEYLRYFRPEERGDPFTELYYSKLRDVLSLVEGKNLNVLDIGGGMGRMALPLAQNNQVLLCDISWDMLESARSRATEDVRYVLADAQSLPFGEGQFDYVLAIDLLVHLPNPQRALAEFSRVLRPGGKLIVDSTNSNPLWTFFYPRYVGSNPLRWTKTIRQGGVLPEWQAIVRHCGKSEFTNMVSSAGFVLLRQLSYGPSICSKWNMVLAARAEDGFPGRPEIEGGDAS